MLFMPVCAVRVIIAVCLQVGVRDIGLRDTMFVQEVSEDHEPPCLIQDPSDPTHAQKA